MKPSANKPAPSARRLAYQALYDILEKGAYGNLTIQQALKSYDLGEAETHLFTELVYGVLRRYNRLLWVISQLSSRPVKKLHPSVRILLCLGLYQLLYLTRIPESAAVNESVKIAKKVTHPGNAGFVNAILRNYIRRKEEIQLFPREENRILYDSLTWNEPEWLVSRWEKEWGEEKAGKVMEAMNRIPSLTVRMNTLKTDKEAFLGLLKEQGIEAEPVSWKKEAFHITKGAHHIWKLLDQGYGYAQSLSSMVPADVLSPKPGERVLDMCAAPGSKTTQLAELMNNEGSIDAWDLYPHKIGLIKNNAKKLGITIIHAGARDSSKPFPALAGAYDRVLLDAPCSGLGVLSHKPEIRWRRGEEGLAEFPPLQEKLLQAAASYVKRGGTLVYSTCTLNREENEDRVTAFLAAHPDFHRRDFAIPNLGKSENGMITIWPDETGSDGFFIAKLVKE